MKTVIELLSRIMGKENSIDIILSRYANLYRKTWTEIFFNNNIEMILCVLHFSVLHTSIFNFVLQQKRNSQQKCIFC